jgi:hypothetical protein
MKHERNRAPPETENQPGGALTLFLKQKINDVFIYIVRRKPKIISSFAREKAKLYVN